SRPRARRRCPAHRRSPRSPRPRVIPHSLRRSVAVGPQRGGCAMPWKCSLSVFLLLVVPIALLVPPAASAADEVFSATTAITLPSGQKVTSFDISFVDPVLGLYLLADRTNKAVDVIDTGTNTVLTQLPKGMFTGTTAC